MMKSSKQLKEERNDILKKMDALVELAKNEKRELSDEEKTQWNDLEARATQMKNDISMAEKVEARAQEKAATAFSIQENRNKGGEKGEKKEMAKKYSVVRAIRSQMPNQKLEGLELEMHQEAENEARANGFQLEGVGMPTFLQEKRDLVVGTATAGGNTVATDLGDMITALRPNLQVEALGATVLSQLSGNLDIPRNNGVGSAAWEGEQDANDETTQSFDKINLSPNRLGAFTNFSKQLLAQSSISVENFVRNDLNMAIRIAVDSAAINGSGSGNQPTGILNISGIGDVAGGTNGLAPTWDHLVDLESELAVDNADMGALAYLTTPGIRGKLKKTKIDTGSGLFVWGQESTSLNGYNAAVSTQVPNDLTKGTNDDCHAIIFGDWSNLILANWGGFDIVVNPFTNAKTATVEVVVNSWWDIAVRHAEKFAAMKDARLS